jgi:hypothetical protein
MAVGTILAVLVVRGSRPSRPRTFRRRHRLRNFMSSATPTWKKDLSRSHPIGEFQYLEQIERYNKDPQHEPFPLPPPRQ